MRIKFITVVKIIVMVVALLLILSVVYVTIEKQKRLFIPLREHVWDPKGEHKNIYLTHSDTSETIHGWLFRPRSSKRVVLFCHGNYGNISYYKYMVSFCENIGMGLFLFDYRGYGKSTGTPATHKIVDDALLAYEYLMSAGYSSKDVIVWGESLGSYVSSCLASKRDCRKLILLSPFSCIEDVVRYSDEFSYVMKYACVSLLRLTGDSLPTKEMVKKVSVPILIIHSKGDSMINVKCSEILLEEVAHKKKKLLLVCGDHSSLRFSVDNVKEVAKFCGFDFETGELEVEGFGDLVCSDCLMEGGACTT